MLGSVEKLLLADVDLASVHAEHMASLTSCVTHCLEIRDSVSKLDTWDSVSKMP